MREKLAVHALILVVVFVIVAGLFPLAAQQNPAIFSAGVGVWDIPAGNSVVQTVSVYNISGGANVTVNSITSNITQLKVVSGTLPITLGPGQRADYGIQFTADAAKSYSGHLTFATATQGSQAVNVTGNGTVVTAVPSLRASSLDR